jgi:NAD(P)H-dependent flavin oxidoreductase YrpB (nitropropane dioxygenase family)
MGSIAGPQLAAAVSEAGGLGMIGTAHPGLSVRTLTTLLDRTAALTTRPFGVNILVGTLDRLGAEGVTLAAERARVVEFFYGEPDAALVRLVHRGGALASWQIGSRDEAAAAVQAGCDFLIAQGVEAGGHVRSRVSQHALLAEVLDVVTVPVLAAGGIGTGRGLAAALAGGADGARLGTRFIAAREANAHPTYIKELISARAEDTVLTETFWVSFPNAPHRVLRSCVAAAEAFGGDTVGEIGCLDDTRQALARFECMGIDAATTGAIEAMSLYAGESVDAVKRVQPAEEIVREIIVEAERILGRLPQRARDSLP